MCESCSRDARKTKCTTWNQRPTSTLLLVHCCWTYHVLLPHISIHSWYQCLSTPIQVPHFLWVDSPITVFDISKYWEIIHTQKKRKKHVQRPGDANISPAMAFPPAQCHPRPRRKCAARRDTWRRSTQRGCPKSCCWFPELCRRECPHHKYCHLFTRKFYYTMTFSYFAIMLMLTCPPYEPRLATGLWYVLFCIWVAGAEGTGVCLTTVGIKIGLGRHMSRPKVVYILYGPSFCWNYSSSALISGWPLFPSTCNKRFPM